MAKRRLQLSISASLERKLILWAHIRDNSLADWIKTVLAIRAADNWAKIQAELQEKADRLGMSLEDYENAVLRKAGFDLDRERKELEDSDE